MWEFLNRCWVKFINGYCEVDFLCYNGEPNWLGWIPLIGIGTIVSLSILFGLLEAIAQEIRGYINKREKNK